MRMRWCVVGACLIAEVGWALPKPEDVKQLQDRLAASRRALERSGTTLEETERKQLLAKLSSAEQSLTRFVNASNQHAKRKGLAPLYAIGGALVVDDVTGVGTADDLLLPIVGLAILVAHVATKPEPSTAELDRAWAEVSARVQELSQAAEQIRSKRKAGCQCKCFKKGSGPLPIGRVPDERTCREECRNVHHYPGYQCGGPVQWN